jgi:hypothetical protein
MNYRRDDRRTAFTLVEMLVASALVIFMMYVIATAFESGLNSFRVLKTQGDMQEKLRAVTSTIRMDLTAMHFGDGKTLSSQLLNDQSWQPPKQGYVRISQPAAPGVLEGMDPDNTTAPYYRIGLAQLPNTYMQFTVNLTDGHAAIRDARGRRDQFMMTPFPGLTAYSWPDYNRTSSSDSTTQTLFTSYWGEVTYFARPQYPPKFADAAQTIPLLNVYRRQKLLVEPAPPNPYPPQYSANSGNIDTSYWAAGNQPFNGSANVTEPLRRWGMSPSAPSGQPAAAGTAAAPFTTILDEVGLADLRAGGDILLTDVINFDIKVLWEPVVAGAANSTRFIQPTKNSTPPDFIPPSPTNNPDYPFDYLPLGINNYLNGTNPSYPAVRIFDTWSANTDTSSGTTFNYGPPIVGPMNQQEFGAWNQGHFTTLPGSPGSLPTQYPIPLRVRVRAIQIKLRIWDQKSQQTRQITIIQDM